MTDYEISKKIAATQSELLDRQETVFMLEQALARETEATNKLRQRAEELLSLAGGVPGKRRRGRVAGTMSAKERRAVSKRMKAYWAARKAA